LPRCKFTTKYIDHIEFRNEFDFYCDETSLASGFCIFHDKDYLQNKTNNEEHKRKILDRLKYKIDQAMSYNESLLCIGFQLPDFRLSDLSINKEFTMPIYFSGSQFFGVANFSGAKFEGEADFSRTNFQFPIYFYNSEFYRKTYFSGDFNGKTGFNYVLFEAKEKVIFDIENLSNVSLKNTDLTGVRFSDKARWGGKKVKEDRFKIIDERLLDEKIKEKDGHTTKDFNLGSIKAVYRNLKENYEYRMRYDEAGQFFIREMELKRKYREVLSSKREKEEEVDNNVECEEEPQPEPEKEQEEDILEIKQNNWFIRNLFSLTAWYYHISRYEESLWRPTLAGVVIVFLSTLFWLIQVNPSAEPSFTNTVGFANATKITVWQRAFERSMADFLPLLSLGSEVKVGLIDYVIKIVGGAVTFGLIAIALRRRFERRYRH
jgi:hypothetical protein